MSSEKYEKFPSGLVEVGITEVNTDSKDMEGSLDTQPFDLSQYDSEQEKHLIGEYQRLCLKISGMEVAREQKVALEAQLSKMRSEASQRDNPKVDTEEEDEKKITLDNPKSKPKKEEEETAQPAPKSKPKTDAEDEEEEEKIAQPPLPKPKVEVWQSMVKVNSGQRLSIRVLRNTIDSALNMKTDGKLWGSKMSMYGQVVSVRKSKRYIFIDVSDGSCAKVLNCIFTRSKIPEDVWTAVCLLRMGCSVFVSGSIQKPPKRATQLFEVNATELECIGGVDADTYPLHRSNINNIHALRKLLFHRSQSLILGSLFRIRSYILTSLIRMMEGRDVVWCDPSILTKSDCEGAGEMFGVTPVGFFNPSGKKNARQVLDGLVTQLDDMKQLLQRRSSKNGEGQRSSFRQAQAALTSLISVMKDDGDAKMEEVAPVGLTVSSQLPLEALIVGLGEVFTMQKSFRAEKSNTNKHLSEFLHFEYEGNHITFDGLLGTMEDSIKNPLLRVMKMCKDDYDLLESCGIESMKDLRKRLIAFCENKPVRIKYCDAVKMILEDVKEGRVEFDEKVLDEIEDDMSTELENYILKRYGNDRIVFLTHWQLGKKAFYMKQTDDGSGECVCVDALVPGIGELIGGSMREHRLGKLEAEMTRREMDMTKMKWYVDLRKSGSSPHGGFGLGVDRLVKLATGVDSVRDIVPFYVTWKHCPY